VGQPAEIAISGVSPPRNPARGNLDAGTLRMSAEALQGAAAALGR
jgi:hypothetical protein